ncbi:hypothetical protein ACOXXX_07125 [Thalassococcus sp. BH17M4-6]|uniref:hypothetical protein n=1 Tax=Thalassococcus sp. BH17M4-6 TaxID=3413148 RepID=UPI003BDFFEE6
MTFFDTGLGLSTVSGWLRWDGWRDSLLEAANRALPDGAIEEEFTEAVLFVLSIRLNGLTGGERDMTFSARCHLSTLRARWWPVRALWAGMSAVIDLYCAAFRNEPTHCRTAWRNHRRRIRRLNRL